MQYKYRALSIKQTGSEKRVLLFAAPAIDVENWAGVPQKKQFDSSVESVGFQREENPARVSDLGEFCSNPENIIQNPLLCATRKLPFASARFESASSFKEYAALGDIVIDVPDYDDFTMVDILAHVREYIESRVPDLKTKSPNDASIAKLKALAISSGHCLPDTLSQSEESDITEDDPLNLEPLDASASDVEGVLFEESHIVDFWQEIASRHEVTKAMDSPPIGEEFLGFTRSALLSYLRPVVLVDGQHRLRGTLRALEDSFHNDSIQQEIGERIAAGESADAVRQDIYLRDSRKLPISLLLSDDPAEQVFQFVVVNQKATPIGRALLGTIISTTLSNDEMETVANRLKAAGIALEESQAVTFLARHPNSPFCGLVERGLAGDSKNLLQWGVFSSLVSIFRDLRGGKLFHQTNDYANVWKFKYLDSSGVVRNFAAKGFSSPFSYWHSFDGPWRDAFMIFFSAIRDKFGNMTTQEADNYWGNPRDSNLFNKISLTILAADFFQYLTERKIGIDDVNEIPAAVEDWLEGVNTAYFSRSWSLSGVKKDSTGIRNQWASLWDQYRKNPSQLPQVRMYRVPRNP